MGKPGVGTRSGSCQHPFFPVEMPDLFRAHIDFRELTSGDTVEVAPQVRVTAVRFTHPNAALGYVLHVEEQRVAYITDHEHPLEHFSPQVREAVAGVDLLIHDAQYSRDEIRNGKRGWGHSAWEDVVHLALEAQVTQLFLFHHDPEATDERLNERQFLAQQIFPPTFVAREGLKIPLHSLRGS
jgi:ribonuclease BN (tRNA processing enzyme)